MKKWWILLSAAVLVACGSKLTNENLAKIEVGMNQQQVQQILGNPSEVETSDALGFSRTILKYRRGGSEVQVVLLNDGVIAKNGTLQ